MDILQIAQDCFLVTFSVIFGIGIVQGSIVARGIRNKFPKLKIHAKRVSVVLLILLIANMIFSTINFAEPTKVSFSEMTIPSDPKEGIFLVIDILGLNTGLVAVVGTFVSITLILLFKVTDMHPVFRYFVFAMGFVMLMTSLVTRFTDYVPTLFQVVMYVFYQLGLTFGIFFVSRRKASDVWTEIE